MEKFCQNPLCETRAIKEVPVSVKSSSDQVRSLCATCEEAYTWGVQHGKKSCPGFIVEPPPKDEGPEPMYRIVYMIDVNAPNPKQAARCAYEIMVDPGSLLPVLYVLDYKGRNRKVDLSKNADEANYRAAAEYLAEQGRKIFTGRLNGGFWNAKCMDAHILSKKAGNKKAYQLLINFGDELSSCLPLSVQNRWNALKGKAAAMLKRLDGSKDKQIRGD